MSYFIYNGISSLEYGIQIEHYPVYPVPERVFETLEIPGRNGDLIRYTGGMRNVVQPYDIFFKPSVPDANSYMVASEVARWLNTPISYAQLEDSYRPGIFKNAIFTGPADWQMHFAKYGKTTLEFNCQPQSWIKDGQEIIADQNGSILYNAYKTAKPMIYISGNGNCSVGIGAYSIGVETVGDWRLIVDSENETYRTPGGVSPVDVEISFGYPVLAERGETQISFSGGVTDLRIVPRWWTL